MKNTYNGLDQLTAQAQSHSGAVADDSPTVQYNYREMADGANDSRLLSMIYPNGRGLLYEYNGLDDAISRVSAITNESSDQTLESYWYQGLGTITERDRAETQTNLYITQDRFGRVSEQDWFNVAAPGDTDQFQYGYDANSNVLYEANILAPSHSELYHASGSGNGYDSLNRMTGFARGTLTAGKDAISGTAGSTQSWSLDALGNWKSVTTDGTEQTRTTNAQNQITSISGATTPTYDAAGNTTRDETGQTYVYDAWNRLVAVYSPDAQLPEAIATYAYDALGRRVRENGRDLYYSGSQIIEERDGGNVVAQNVWSLAYTDALVCRDVDADGNSDTGELGADDSGLDTRYYVQQDADWNVTAVVDGTPGSGSLGSVLERYEYDPYGKVTVLTPDFTAKTVNESSVGWLYYEQGGRMDVVTGNLHFGAREYRPSLGRWMQVDPIGYGDGMDAYQYEHGGPAGGLDPGGMADCIYNCHRLPPARTETSQPDPWSAAQRAAIRSAILQGPAHAEARAKAQAQALAQGQATFAQTPLEEVGITDSLQWLLLQPPQAGRPDATPLSTPCCLLAQSPAEARYGEALYNYKQWELAFPVATDNPYFLDLWSTKQAMQGGWFLGLRDIVNVSIAPIVVARAGGFGGSGTVNANVRACLANSPMYTPPYAPGFQAASALVAGGASRGFIGGDRLTIRQKVGAARSGDRSAAAEVRVAKYLRAQGSNVDFIPETLGGPRSADLWVDDLKAEVKLVGGLGRNAAYNVAVGAYQAGPGGTVYVVRPSSSRFTLEQYQTSLLPPNFVPRTPAVDVQILDEALLPPLRYGN